MIDGRATSRQLRRHAHCHGAFQHSTIKDWPIEYYAELRKLVTEAFACALDIVGSPSQALQAAKLFQLLKGSAALEKVTDFVRKTRWSDMPEILRASRLVVCNNSGIAHQAARLGADTLAIYSASHQPLEWGPRGDHSRPIMARVSCSPGGLERIEDCMHDHLCRRLLAPPAVFRQIEKRLSHDAAS